MKWTGYLYGYLLLAVFALVYLCVVIPVQKTYFTSILKFRKEKDYFVKNSEDSPFENDTIDEGEQLRYFPIEEKFRFESGVGMFERQDTLELEVLGANEQKKDLFVRYGKVVFTYRERVFNLVFFKHVDEQEDEHFFLPFTDNSNRMSTFERGRYLDLYIDSNRVIQKVDFNMAYNPFCAYNKNYCCPVPPKENHLPFRVEAGEMKLTN